MSPTQDFPLYTTDPTTGELVPVENGQYLSQAEVERRRRARERAQQQAIRHAANDERTSAFGYFTFCRYISSAPFWANMPNADLVRLFYLSTHMLYERSTLCYSNGIACPKCYRPQRALAEGFSQQWNSKATYR